MATMQTCSKNTRATLAACTFLAFGSRLDAQSWTQTSAPVTNWSSVACSADGRTVVASVDGQIWGGSGWVVFPGLIFLSTDSGATWTATSAPSTNWSCVTCSADGTKMAAFSVGGMIYTSTNSGGTWLPSAAPSIGMGATVPWGAATSSADGTRLLAVAHSYWYPIYLSTNSGATWTPVGSGGAWSGLACSSDGMKMTATYYWIPGGPIDTSPDGGLTWVGSNAPELGWGAAACSADGVRQAAVTEYGSIYLSTNAGGNWASTSAPDEEWWSVASSADGVKLVAASLPATSQMGGVIYTSSDSGSTWVSNSAPELAWASVASSADGCKLVAVTGNGGIYTRQETPRPKLNFAPSTSGLVLSWTVPSVNFDLQQAPDLTSGKWATVPAMPTLNYTTLQYQVSIPKPQRTMFYRLVAQ